MAPLSLWHVYEAVNFWLLKGYNALDVTLPYYVKIIGLKLIMYHSERKNNKS